MLYVHIGIASMRQLKCVPTTHVTEIKETCFEIYIYKKSCPLALPLKHLNPPIMYTFTWQLYHQT